MDQSRRSVRLITPLGPNVLNAVRFDGHEGLSELFEFTIDAVSQRSIVGGGSERRTSEPPPPERTERQASNWAASAGLPPVDFDRLIGHHCTLVHEGKSIGGAVTANRERDERERPPQDDERRREGAASAGGASAPRRFSGILTEARYLGIDNDYYLYRLTLRPWLWLLSHIADCRIYHEKDVPTIIRDVFTRSGFQDFEFRLTSQYLRKEYVAQYRETNLDFVLRMMEEEGMYYYFEHKEGSHTLIVTDSPSGHKTLASTPVITYLPRLLSGRSDIESIYEINSVRRFQFGKVSLNDYNYNTPAARMLTDYTKAAPHTRGELEIYDYPGRYPETAQGTTLARVILEAEQATDKRRFAVGDVVHMLPGGLTTLARHPVAGENIEYLIVRCQHAFEEQAYRSVAATQNEEPYSGSYELLPSSTPFRAPRVTRRPCVYGPQTAKVVNRSGEKGVTSGEEINVDDKGRICVQFHWDRLGSYSRWVRIAQTWAGKQWGTIVIPRVGMEVVVEFLEGDPDQPLVTGCVYNEDFKPPYALPDNKTKTGIKSNSSMGGGGFNEFVFEDKKGEEAIEIHGQKDLKIKILDSETREVAEKLTGSAARTTTLHKGDDKLELKTGSQTVDIKVDQTTKVGKKITLEADVEIELKVGGSTIKMTQTEIKISAGGTFEVKAPGKGTVDGGGMMTLKAGIININ